MLNNDDSTTNGKSTTENNYVLNKYETDSTSLSLEITSAKKIERYWLAHRDRQIFRLLKHSICAAEHSLSKEILRKISPLESNLLNDPCLDVKIKFRFAGEEYPPYIVFKIYTQTHDGNTAKYFNGKDSLKSKAAREACNQMGSRQYFNLMILDTLQAKSKNKITDKENVISIRDFMQYSSVLDELPAYMGGRSNAWRRLNLNDLPRYTIFYDVLNYATTKKMTRNLAKEMPTLLKAPTTQEIHYEHIKILSKLELPSDDSLNQSTMYLNSTHSKSSLKATSSRRSKNALSKIAKMKKIYSMARSETLTSEADMATSVDPQSESFKLPDDLNDDFENEVRNLYMWTKNLSLNDVDSI